MWFIYLLITLSLVVSCGAFATSIYNLYKLNTTFLQLQHNYQTQNDRFSRLVEAVNKVNFEEYKIDASQEELIMSLFESKKK